VLSGNAGAVCAASKSLRPELLKQFRPFLLLSRFILEGLQQRREHHKPGRYALEITVEHSFRTLPGVYPGIAELFSLHPAKASDRARLI